MRRDEMPKVIDSESLLIEVNVLQASSAIAPNPSFLPPD